MLAVSLISSTTILGIALGLVCLCFAGYVITQQRGGPAVTAGPASSALTEQALDIAQKAYAEKLGFFSGFFRAIAARDKAKLDEAIMKLRILFEDGQTFGILLESFTYEQVKVILADPERRMKLLRFVSSNGNVVISTPSAPTVPAASGTV